MSRLPLGSLSCYLVVAALAVGHVHCVCAADGHGGPALCPAERPTPHHHSHSTVPEPGHHDEWCPCEATPPTMAASPSHPVADVVAVVAIVEIGENAAAFGAEPDLHLPLAPALGVTPPDLRSPPVVLS